MDKDPNVQIKELRIVMKRVNERDKGVLRWFVSVEKIENERIPKRVYVG